MDEHKHLHRRHEEDESRLNTEGDQLRDQTMNEIIRETHGGPDADISALNDEAPQGGLGRNRDDEDLQGTDSTRGVGYNPNDASAVRSGGTTDMDDQTAGGAGLAGERLGSSNVNTKRNVTGSDFDGQNATS